MNISEPETPCHLPASRCLKTILVVACLLAFATGAIAQQVFVPLPTIAPEQPPPPPETTSTNAPESSSSAAPETPINRPPPELQWGPVRFHPHFAYQFLYGDGILSQPGQTQKTALNQISPGIRFDIGRVWQLDYTPTISLYSDPTFKNTVNQYINLFGSTSYDDWKFGLSQNCALTSNPQVQTGQQTDQQEYITTLNAVCQLNSSLSLELGARQDLFFLNQSITNSGGNSLDWSTLDWLDYHWGQNVGTGIGAGVGYTQVEFGSDMTYEQAQARVNWHLARKINLAISGGAEFRQFLDSSGSMLISPVSSASIIYQPFDPTTLTLTGSRTVSPSYFENLVSQIYNVNLGLSQRLLGTLYLGLSGGYSRTQYKASGTPNPTDPNIGRDDDYTSFAVSLNTLIRKRGTASAYYSISRNLSNRAGFSYDSTQVGFQLTWRY
jgi:hypothetical protein